MQTAAIVTLIVSIFLSVGVTGFLSKVFGIWRPKTKWILGFIMFVVIWALIGKIAGLV